LLKSVSIGLMNTANNEIKDFDFDLDFDYIIKYLDSD